MKAPALTYVTESSRVIEVSASQERKVSGPAGGDAGEMRGRCGGRCGGKVLSHRW